MLASREEHHLTLGPGKRIQDLIHEGPQVSTGQFVLDALAGYIWQPRRRLGVGQYVANASTPAEERLTVFRADLAARG